MNESVVESAEGFRESTNPLKDILSVIDMTLDDQPKELAYLIFPTTFFDVSTN